MATYKGITFAEEHRNVSFADFKKMFASNRFFLEVPHTEREAELKRVHKKIKPKPKSANISESNKQREETNKK
tara:strand:+ start:734 stop:952 length:219 start_codon:yes stop_codon:yes gene_type:complete